MFRKSFYLVLILTSGLLFLQACNQKDAFQTEYPEVTDNKHLFEIVSVDKVLSMIENKETGIIVLGFKSCPWCQKLMPYVNQVVKEKNHEVIYYVDIKEMRDNPESFEHEKYLQMKEKFSAVVDTERDRINAPTTIMLKDGEVLGFHLDTVRSHVKNDNNILPPLTSEQETELLGILRNLFIDMNE